MSESPPIRVPWPNRFRHWLTQRLQAALFIVSVVVVVILWQRQAPRVVLTGQVESVQVVVAAPRDGILEPVDSMPVRFDPVQRGVTAVARFDITQALLEMESLTAERRRLQAELDSQRERLQQERSDREWQVTQRRQQAEQRELDRQRVRLSNRARVDSLRSEVADLNQRRRETTVARRENEAQRERLAMEIDSSLRSRERVSRLVELRMSPPAQLAELEESLELNRAMHDQAVQLAETLSTQAGELAEQIESTSRRLSRAETSADEVEQALAVTTAGEVADDSGPIDEQALLEPYHQALAVQDAKIRELAHQIASNEIHAPATGQIAEVHQRPGAFVRVGDPIVTIASPQRRWVVAYIDRLDRDSIQPDASVKIRSTNGLLAESGIQQWGSRYELVPVPLRRNRNIDQWGVAIKVPLPDSAQVMPGETVELIIE